MKNIIFGIAAIFIQQAFSHNSSIETNDNIPVYTYLIVNSIPHDHNAYTQGLVYHKGYLYESTGRRGQSSLRKVDLNNGAIIKSHYLPEQFFGEGITIFNNRIIQLTWQSYTGFVYDVQSLVVIEEFYYNNEGWGITQDGENLIMSDGSATLYFLDPETYAVEKKIEVSDSMGPIFNLNELEYIQGEIFANIFSSNRIARIDPNNGNVVGWIDLSDMKKLVEKDFAVDVLNGIAYDEENDRLFVTGKLWPKVYEIRLIKKVDY